MNIIKHPINDNELRINNQEYFGLDVDRVIVGVENKNIQEIVTNPESKLNYSRNAVEEQEIYNFSKQAHNSWLIIDLETGSRGWYPGCEIHGDIIGVDIPLMSEPSQSSELIKNISNCSISIWNIDAIDAEPWDAGWYKIRYDVEGYVEAKYVSNLRYENPF